jgi:hypothetical protein
MSTTVEDPAAFKYAIRQLVPMDYDDNATTPPPPGVGTFIIPNIFAEMALFEKSVLLSKRASKPRLSEVAAFKPELERFITSVFHAAVRNGEPMFNLINKLTMIDILRLCRAICEMDHVVDNPSSNLQSAVDVLGLLAPSTPPQAVEDAPLEGAKRGRDDSESDDVDAKRARPEDVVSEDEQSATTDDAAAVTEAPPCEEGEVSRSN